MPSPLEEASRSSSNLQETYISDDTRQIRLGELTNSSVQFPIIYLKSPLRIERSGKESKVERETAYINMRGREQPTPVPSLLVVLHPKA